MENAHEIGTSTWGKKALSTLGTEVMVTASIENLSEMIDTEDLIARCFGNIDFVNRILLVLQERCEADIQELEIATAEVNFERIGSISHRLKGALANAAVNGLRDMADRICQASKTEAMDVIQSNLELLKTEWKKLASSILEGKAVLE